MLLEFRFAYFKNYLVVYRTFKISFDFAGCVRFWQRSILQLRGVVLRN